MTTRREFIKTAAAIAGGAVLPGACATGRWSPTTSAAVSKSRVVSAAAEDMLIESRYNPAAIGRAFAAGMKELTGEKTEAAAWASLFSPDDVVGIKINCLGAPRVSSSIESVNAVAAGLKSAGVKDNAVIVWDRLDREFQRTGLTLNKGPVGM
ncbi:MAG: twin-arginine translocation signal domain-containing protein, partial [Candidatus Aminicenantes bacterium]|nr:twin-arginine translocation signal domain-containing protein [Candidatus Aminicenantes bacterium]